MIAQHITTYALLRAKAHVFRQRLKGFNQLFVELDRALRGGLRGVPWTATSRSALRPEQSDVRLVPCNRNRECKTW
jgi:hypothetical protein